MPTWPLTGVQRCRSGSLRRVDDGHARRCVGDLRLDLRQSERVAKQVASAPRSERERARFPPQRASCEADFMHAKASESGHLKRSFSSPPVARATKKGHCAIGCAVAPWGKRSWLTVWGECLEQCEEYRYLSTVVEMVAREVGKKREVFTLHTSRVACINHACSAANPTCGNVKTCIEN